MHIILYQGEYLGALARPAPKPKAPIPATPSGVSNLRGTGAPSPLPPLHLPFLFPSNSPPLQPPELHLSHSNVK